jgi:hypothetical protein
MHENALIYERAAHLLDSHFGDDSEDATVAPVATAEQFAFAPPSQMASIGAFPVE